LHKNLKKYIYFSPDINTTGLTKIGDCSDECNSPIDIGYNLVSLLHFIFPPQKKLFVEDLSLL